MSGLAPQTPSKTALIRSEKGTFLPGNPGGPGHPKGLKNRSTLIQEAKEQLCVDLLQAEPYKRFYKRWFRNYAIRHPKEALELLVWMVEKLGNRKTGAHAHVSVNLVSLINATPERGRAHREDSSGD